MHPKKILLLVDDNEQQLSALAYTVRVWGYKTLTTSSPQEAITLFTDNRVDLVLTDLFMPKMNGADLCRQLKAINPYIPMVILGDVKKMNGTVHVADAILHKPTITSAELCERIKVMSARKRGPRPGNSIAMQPSALSACLA